MPKVLIADDDPVQRQLLEGVLTRLGHQAESVADGEEALERMARTPRPDILLLDLDMPVRDGMSVLVEMRARQIAVPTIVQTAQGGLETVVRAVRDGAQDFFVKPVGPERLQVSIENALKSGALSSEIRRIKLAPDGHAHLRRRPHEQPQHAGGHAHGRAGGGLRHPGPSRRRERRRQGDRRAGHSRHVEARPKADRRGQLRRPARPSRREHPFRPREGGLHRRDRGTGRQVRGGRRRHALPRRGRRAAARGAGETAARRAGGRGRRGRGRAPAQDRRAHRLGDQSESWRR